jgi:amino acid adenylation domain-containing protein
LRAISGRRERFAERWPRTAEDMMSNLVEPATPPLAGSAEHDPFAGPAIAEVVPTTEPQREIWTATQVSDEASLSYNEGVTLWMSGPLDLDALRGSLGAVVARHEAMRSTFSLDGLTMVIGAEAAVPVEIVDVAGRSADSVRAAWEALLAHEASERFDLSNGPVARVKVFRIGPEEHRVVFTAHHIVCDGWSTAVVVREWAALYSGQLGGTVPALAAPDAFSAYAREETSPSPDRQRAAAEDEAYWLARYADDVPILELPLDRPRPPLKTYASHREDGALDAGLIRDLRKVGSAERASLFAVLLAGFEVLLARLSGQEDVVVGVPAAGQSVGGHDGLVGHCVNMLPLRARVDPEQPFRAMLSEARSKVLDAYEHQQYTFGSLLRRLPLVRDPSRLPLVSVVFNLDRGLGPDAMRFEGLRTELTTNARLFENFDLFLNAVEIGGKVALECQYNTDLFDRETVRRWLGVYECILRSVCERPDEQTGRLRVLTGEDAARLDAWNAASALRVRTDARVHDLIADQVAATPGAIAVETEGARLTYAELDARANGLALRLRELGIARGSLVGLCLDRSPEMVVGVLGILKAGGAYVPLDPAYPVDRLDFMVKDSRMRALVTARALRAELPIEVAHVIEVESLESAGTLGPENAPDSEGAATVDDPAYVIYTSGSTGVPKGVLVPHRSVVNLLASVREEPGMTAADVVLAVTTLSFDIAVSEILLPLTVGAKIALASREVASDGQRLLSLMHESKATFLDATPATWRLLLAAGWKGGEGLKAICTGEAMPRDLGLELLKRCSSVWNGYGPTETTVWSTFWRAREPLGRVLIGKPVANTHLYVVDARMQRVPIGVVGELFIGGAGVTLGYHERDELTRERFLPDPHRGPGARMYKTGDLVRYLADGNVECLGRNDSQVKIRGYRIELGEIENALSHHPSVAQAAALAREDRPGDVRLVGYAAMHAGQGATDADLRGHLKKTLPDYMVPQVFVRLDRMPLLPNGKIDRKKLPAPLASDRTAEDTFVAPRTPLEHTLATLWEEVLAVGRVGVHDDFFALGGHSLLASQVIARLRRDHGVEISFRKMFEAPTIDKLASSLEGAPAASPGEREAQIPRRPVSDVAPLSVSQRRMWLLEEMDPAQRLVHNLCASWRLEGKLDVGALQAAVDAIVARHDTLRTNFRVEGSEPLQVIHGERAIPMRFVDLTDLPEAERLPALAAARDARAIELFDLAVDPLLRITLFKLADETHLISTVQHNIVWDGWSFDLFLSELSALYGAFSKGLPSPLQPLPIAYGDFAVWQSEWMAGPAFEKQATFWRTLLASAKRPLEVPTDRPRRGSRSHGGASEGVHIPLARAEALTAMARGHRATLFMVVFAAFNVLLYRLTGQRELLVGTPVRARTRPELEGLIGPFVNAVALKTTVDPSMTFVDLLEHVRDLTLDAFGSQEVPLDALGEHAPMLRALFSLQDARTRPVALGDLRLTQDHALAPVAANEMMLWAMESRTDMLLMLNFATELFDAATARRFLAQMEVLFEQIERDPEQKIATIALLPREEREAIAKAGGAVDHTSIDVVSLVRRATERSPASPAVTCEGRTLTYSELMRRVDALTRRLIARGILPGTTVGLGGLRGEDRVIATLAIAGAGARWMLAGDGAPAAIIDDATADAAADGAYLAPASPEAVAYVADGVDVRQAALARAAQALATAVGLESGDVAASSSRLEDANGIVAVLAALVAGASLVVPASDGSDALSVAISASRSSAAFAPASAWRTVAPASLRKAIVFGRPSDALGKKLSDAGCTAFVVYVPATLGLPAAVSTAGSAGRRMLGRPLAGMAWRIEDERGQMVPLGVSGELMIETAEGVARTGDRARLLAGGDFEHTGRADGRVDVAGRLVDLGGIARAIEGHPAVLEAFVDVCDDVAGEPRIVAYFVPRHDASCTETELRARARAIVGEHGTPRLFMELDALPRDSAGEIVHARLPSPYAVSNVHQHVAPRSDAEKYVANAWKEALGVARIGVHDNFFDLGGHSLLCFRVIARIEADTHKRISPRLMLLNSLEHVAAQLETAKAAAPLSSASAAATPTDTRTASGRPFAARVLDRLKGLVRG